MIMNLNRELKLRWPGPGDSPRPAAATSESIRGTRLGELIMLARPSHCVEPGTLAGQAESS